MIFIQQFQFMQDLRLVDHLVDHHPHYLPCLLKKRVAGLTEEGYNQ